MAINQSKYIEIISGVGGESVASRRELIARLMTTNILAPTASVLEMSSVDAVLSYFGSDSDEYKLAVKYFSFVSKSITTADKISFARYTPSATAPALTSTETLASVTSFSTITDGSAVFSLGGDSVTFTGVDFSLATDLDEVAAIIQNEIRSTLYTSDLWTLATVANTSGIIQITGGETGAADIAYMSAGSTGTDFSSLLRMDTANSPVLSVGSDAETPAESLSRVDGVSDNFGSFAFVETLTDEEIGENAAWNAAKNYKYLYSVVTNASGVDDLMTEIGGNIGVAVTLDAFDDYAHFMPMALFASTDYDRTNAVKNYMYQQFDGESASVTTDADSDKYDALSVNYYGATQQAGKTISFYQDGYMADGGDIGPYTNEIWLKDAFSTSYLNLLLALEMIPSNETGESIAVNDMQAIITDALSNGTISVGKTLTSTQKAYIGQITDDEDAYIDVGSRGYWLNVTIESEVVGESTQYILKYALVYSKADSIRKIEGSDILI